MGWNIFKKFRKEDNVIDLANLQKRGILKEKKDTLDLTSSATVESSPLGFIGSLAGSAENSDILESSEIVSSIVEGSDGKTKLRGILRDIKMKIDGTSNRVYKLSDRIDLLEKKLERLERRAGYGA